MEIFTRAQWRASGLSLRALATALERGEVWRVFRGVYAMSGVPDAPEIRARAVRLIRPPGTVVVRQTAAWIAGIDVLPPGRSILDEPVWLGVPQEMTAPRIAGCRARRAQFADEDLVEMDGLTRTTDLRTALDLGRFLPRRQAVAAIDAFLHAGLVTLDDLWDRSRLLVQARNCRRLSANLEVADGGAESYAESEQRVLFIDAGLPRPRTQIPVCGLAGDLIGYVDMGWLGCLLGSEFDGSEGHGSEEQLEHDKHRRGRIHRETDWLIDVTRGEQLWGTPAALAAHTAHLLLQRGWQPEMPAILEQLSRAVDYEAKTGLRWDWMPLDRLRAA
jgi:hypothetical protein